MGLVTQPVVSALPTQGARGAQDGASYDYAIGGISFLSDASEQIPYLEETAEYRKPQVDQAKDVGEQSLVYWWLKSQTGFHGGAGQKYLDTVLVSEPYQPIRFESSSGVDVFTTPGSVSLLHDTTSFLSSANQNVRVQPTSFGFAYADGTAFKHVVGGTTYTITAGNAGSILAIAVAGATYYVADATGVYSGTLNNTGGTNGSLIWNTGNATVVMSWVKSRLMAFIGSKVYELAGTGPALPTAKFTAPSTFTASQFADSPAAIYLGGYDSAKGGVIYKFVIDSSGAVPTLSGAIVTAELPSDEPVYALRGSLGSYMAIGTGKGIRTAIVDSTTGDLTYGPNLMQFEGKMVVACFPQDRFIYALAADPTGAANLQLYVVDLGQAIAYGRFAYASHLSFAAMTGTSGTVCRDAATGLMVIASAQKIYKESTLLVASGSLTTSRIRFGTLEPKLVKYFGYEVDGSAGLISVSFTSTPGTVHTVGPLPTGNYLGLQTVTVAGSPVESLQATITLTASSTTVAPALRAYQIKALPAQKRQRQFTVPLRCYDFETDKSGQRVGQSGYSASRLRALEALEEAGDSVLFETFSLDGIYQRSVVIDKLQFVQRVPPQKQSQVGGTLVATLRAID